MSDQRNAGGGGTLDQGWPSPSAPPLPAHSQLWLVRHGETDWSKSGQHTGRTDLELTDHGVEQALALRPLLAGLNPALVLSSPRQRALRTAALAGVRVDDVTDDMAEWDYGEYEGLTTAQIQETDPDWTVWFSVSPGGETRDEVCARADRVLQRAVERLDDGPVVLFGHGHINRVLAARWLGMPVTGGSAFALGTAAPCLLGVEHARPVIVRWNIANPAAA